MFIDIGEIRKSPGHNFHFDLKEDIQTITVDREEVGFQKPVEIFLDIKNTSKVLVFTGRITADTKLVCNRCLESYHYRLNTSFIEKFYHTSDVAEISDEGMDIGDMRVFEGNRINVLDIIVENIILAIPMKLICQEECKGLCNVCGTNLNNTKCVCESENIDPRLGILKKYFEQ